MGDTCARASSFAALAPAPIKAARVIAIRMGALCRKQLFLTAISRHNRFPLSSAML
jgi:hypothetical protein